MEMPMIHNELMVVDVTTTTYMWNKALPKVTQVHCNRKTLALQKFVQSKYSRFTILFMLDLHLVQFCK